jgi:hypothetical protein
VLQSFLFHGRQVGQATLMRIAWKNSAQISHNNAHRLRQLKQPPCELCCETVERLRRRRPHHKHVGRLQIIVDKAALVQVLQTFAHAVKNVLYDLRL